ncbi:ABC transporter ATP-binding protein [Paenibacillus hemerocallicola]|uniref:ABC transporter ATP-binding protein n=1 Tax=Paenibacillus hemerocallicola TaxID=1172614 RepID=A0A5C4TAC5_9BACL|nr:ABC transporter ATP-binding protein [Paenibacillus hemerocallicola]TNJ65855.1 ABC transporter ATP-binding protein [Paenibacillus hemerocallicola]
MELLHVHIEQAGYEERDNVIRNVAFTLGSGQLVGLIGPNGAGKSTTIKAILGLIKKTKGEVRFSGPQGNYAYIPEHPILYEELTLWEHLELAAAAYGLKADEFRERAEELLAQFKLGDVRHHLTTSFSKGMQQKVMLIIGFLTKPDVYIVDEPFIGLDPKATKELLDTLNAERRRGAAILMSTHVLDTAERICDSFVLLNAGETVAQGDLDQIRSDCGMPGASLFECFHTLT